jgi:hypothetical protein
VANSLFVFSKSMRKRLLRPQDFFAAGHPQAHRGGQIIVFEADTHALRKRLPPKQALGGRWRFEEGKSLRARFLGSFRIAPPFAWNERCTSGPFRTRTAVSVGKDRRGTKLSASFGSPFPEQRAKTGYGKTGRERSTAPFTLTKVASSVN